MALPRALSRFVVSTALAASLVSSAAAQAPPALVYDRLVPGFLPENKNANGGAIGTGFATANPWGAYTAYLMATNAKGQRTWRVENYLQNGNSAQSSTMYLLEGSERALLIDTANNTPEVMAATESAGYRGEFDLGGVEDCGGATGIERIMEGEATEKDFSAGAFAENAFRTTYVTLQ